MTSVVGYSGRAALDALHAGGMVCVLIVDTLNWLFVQPLRGKGLRLRSTVEHFVEFGVRSMPIVGLICFLVGVIIAMQSAYTLEKWGATKFIANLVGISALRELAPLMTAVLITGRCGSAITAEIGTMKVAEEIDALHVMGLNPTKFLIVPKFLAMLVAVPCVTVLAMFIMILGGFLLSCSPLVGVDPVIYYEQTVNSLVAKDMVTGVVKSIFFGITICWVGIYRGFQVEGGAEGVGRKTTSSVVTSIFLIILLDLVWTTLFYFA
ncbi:MAG TPA: ABC transporter permease [Candidatus Hydrogenedentes bacterium]|nr:ABC transporter permease [Candidatus Hydrogenedentota bacterium]HNT87059.1 ABC transporter permease [Candidatus Hydrogenedentota bacterium]